MGKGSGDCERTSLVSTLNTATPIGGIQYWMQATGINELEAAMSRVEGLERWVIAERLRILRGGAERDLDWRDWDLPTTIMQARESEGQLHPILLDGGIAKDGVVYLERYHPREEQIIPFFHMRSAISKIRGITPEVNGNSYLEWEEWGDEWEPGDTLPNMLETLCWQGDKALQANDNTTAPPSPDELYDLWNGLTGKPVNDIWHSFTEDQRRAIAEECCHIFQSPGKWQTNKKQWTHTGRPTWRLLADIDVAEEGILRETLLRQGARLESHALEVPEYESVHDIEGGKAYVIDLPEGRIEYVPHGSVGQQHVQYTTYTVEWTPDEEQIKQLAAGIDNHFGERAHEAEDMVRISTKPDGSGKIVSIARAAEVYQLSEEDVRALIAGEEPSEAGKHFAAVTDDQLEEIDAFRRSDLGWMERRAHHRLKRQRAGLEDFKQARTYEFTTDDIGTVNPRWHDEKETLTDEQTAELKAFRLLEKKVRQQSKERHWPRGVVRSMTDDKGVLRSSVNVETAVEEKVEEIPHRAPMSERGIITITGSQPRAALASLKRIGVAGEPHDQIPHGLLYGDSPARGRILPVSEEYAIGGAHVGPSLHGDYVPLHGMTGVQNGTAALQRLDKIIELGGLKSTAERRRIGLAKLNSLSPRGDIASGIDHGVPCTVGTAPSFGTHLLFVMDRDAMARRDVWFSDQDFGAGHNRYDSYNAYAQQIGQGKMHQPPSVTAREEHYDTLEDYPENEMYFKHEIPWRDIHTLVASVEVYDDTVKRINKAKADGLVPDRVRVVQIANPDEDSDITSSMTEIEEAVAIMKAQSLYSQSS